MASAFAQYYIFAYVLFALACVTTTGLLWVNVFSLSGNTPLRIVFEVSACVCARARLTACECVRAVFKVKVNRQTDTQTDR